ncbi:MAG TPA: lysine--tRNA ligase [Clostridiales bacterium]|nr:lysine--tRNA ligase [Clostridiales bacterium]
MNQSNRDQSDRKQTGQVQTEENLNEILQVRREKLESLREAGKNPYEITKFRPTHYSEDILAHFDQLEDQKVTLAGRMMSKRIMGKASFAHILDSRGKIQMYVQINALGKEAYEDFKAYDIGDIVGVTGSVFRTRRGEITVRAQELTLLSKSLQPLPEKWHGLKDPDLRYRQRYVDMIVNPEVRHTFVTRSRILQEIRKYLDSRGYLEVETPVLHNSAGGAAARPFVTHHNALDIDMYMRIATELHLKRLVVGGFDKVYEIGRIFRNEGMDIKHNPEFTTIELYEAYADYQDMMSLTENMVSTVAEKVLGSDALTYQGEEVNLTPPWDRITMIDAVRKYAGVDMSAIQSDEGARKAAEEIGVPTEGKTTWGEVLYAIFEEKVEEQLRKPAFVMDYPIEISPLAKRKKEDPRLTYRFEIFISGRELGNAFSELNDPIDQRERFVEQARQRAAGNEEAERMDEDFVNALEVGMPPTGGLGIGIDRLVMLLTDSYSIRDVILFPTMKPLDKSEPSVKTEKPAGEKTAKAVKEVIDFSKVEIEPLFKDEVDFDTFSKSDFRAVKVKDCFAVPKSKKLLQFTLDDGTGGERTILSGIHAYYEPEELIGKTLIAIINLPPRSMMGVDSCGMLLSAIHEEEGKENLHLLMVDDHIPAGAKLY